MIAVPSPAGGEAKPEAAAQTYAPTLGPDTVEVADDVILHDAARNKDVIMRVYYPREEGRYPVIIFSHGAGHSKDAAPRLMRYWSSHGYLCILPTQGTKRPVRTVGGIVRTVREFRRRNELGPDAWADRAADISFVANSLPELEARVPGLKGKMDAERMAIAGHSFGAYTAALIGGATLYYKSGGTKSYKDNRMRAVLLLSGAGRDAFGLTEKSWQRMTLPMMVMAGSDDPGIKRAQGPLWRAEPFRFAPPGDKYLVFITGANHLTYLGPWTDAATDAGGPLHWYREKKATLKHTRDKSFLFDCVKIASLAFWDAYLKDDEKAKAYLASSALEDFSQGWVKISRK